MAKLYISKTFWFLTTFFIPATDEPDRVVCALLVFISETWEFFLLWSHVRILGGRLTLEISPFLVFTYLCVFISRSGIFPLGYEASSSI